MLYLLKFVDRLIERMCCHRSYTMKINNVKTYAYFTCSFSHHFNGFSYGSKLKINID